MLLVVLLPLLPVLPLQSDRLSFEGEFERERGTRYEEERELARDRPRLRSYLEVALDDETFWASYGRRFSEGDGRFAIGILGGDDNQFVGNVRILGTGFSDKGSPVEIGFGLAAYFLRGEDPDVSVQAIALTASVSTEFGTDFPLRAVAEISHAPDVSTFDDGDRLVDGWARLELVASERAQIFVGYRLLNISLDDQAGGGDVRFGESLQFGVRLSW